MSEKLIGEGGLALGSLTAWYSADVKPARNGVYETPSFNPARYELYQHWNGKFWGGWADSPEAALNNSSTKSSRQNPMWRGLAKEPK